MCAFSLKEVFEHFEEKNMEECRATCAQYAFLTRTWRRKRHSNLVQILSEGPLYVQFKVNSSYHREEP